jgi:RNA polymerase-binding transcription factor DksA
MEKAFINRQKEALEKEKNKLSSRIEILKKEDPFTDPDHVMDNAAVDTDVREQVGHDTIEAEVKDLQRKLDDVALALVNIHKNRYGICEKCGMAIVQARLEIVPEARFCIEDEKNHYT